VESHEELILHYLRRKSGEIVPYWEALDKLADVLVGRIVGRVTPKSVRVQKRAELNKTLKKLIAQKKVIRYCHPKAGRKAGVRINEALA